jgi:integrase
MGPLEFTALGSDGELLSACGVEGEMGAARLDDARDAVLSDYVSGGKKNVGKVRLTYQYLRAAWGNILLRAITYAMLAAYATHAQTERASGTVLGELRLLHRGLVLMQRQGMVRAIPPFPTVKASKPRQGFFGEEEIFSVIEHLPPYLRGLVGFLNLTGWRKHEAETLPRVSVDWDSQVIRLGDSKNGNGRLFPFGEFPSLKEILVTQEARAKHIEHLTGKPVEFLFGKDDGTKVVDWRNAWARACKAAGVHRHVHDLRRTAIRRFEQARIPRAVAMALSGHKTLSIYLRYSVVDEGAMREAIAPLTQLLRGTSSHAQSAEKRSKEEQTLPKDSEKKPKDSENKLLPFDFSWV